MQEELCDEYAEFFRGKTEEDLEEVAKSFSLGTPCRVVSL